MRHGWIALLAAWLVLPAAAQEAFDAMPTDVVSGRLAGTPAIDGKVRPHEWDPFMRGSEMMSYLQWDFEALYVAATLPEDMRLLVSLDGSGDGWLVGADNVQILVTMAGDRPSVTASRLNASNPAGPEWEPAEMVERSMTVAASSDGISWTVELRVPAIETYGLKIEDGKRMAARADAVEGTRFEPHLPRACAPIALVMDKGFAVPDGVTWKPGFRARRIEQGADLHMGFEVKNEGTAALAVSRIRFEGYGETSEWIDTVERSFEPVAPGATGKSDYDTRTKLTISPGFHTVKVTCTLESGDTFDALCSFEVLPPITFEWGLPEVVTMEDGGTSVPGWVRVRNNTSKRLDGTFDMELPPGWEMKRGQGKRFILYRPAEKFRIGVEFVIPAGEQGVYEVTALARLLTGNITGKRFILIQPPGASVTPALR